jgi:hypothetical protein
MELPPPSILKAALEVMFTCAYTTRNWTLDDSISRKQINDLWEAVHEIPSLLTRWRPDAEVELIRYLDEYAKRWPAPDLKARYLQVRDGAV